MVLATAGRSHQVDSKKSAIRVFTTTSKYATKCKGDGFEVFEQSGQLSNAETQKPRRVASSSVRNTLLLVDLGLEGLSQIP